MKSGFEHSDPFQSSRPAGAGLGWPTGRQLFRRRRTVAARIAATLALAGLLAAGLSLMH